MWGAVVGAELPWHLSRSSQTLSWGYGVSLDGWKPLLITPKSFFLALCLSCTASDPATSMWRPYDVAEGGGGGLTWVVGTPIDVLDHVTRTHLEEEE